MRGAGISQTIFTNNFHKCRRCPSSSQLQVVHKPFLLSVFAVGEPVVCCRLSQFLLCSPCRCRYLHCKPSSLRGVADFSISLANFSTLLSSCWYFAFLPDPPKGSYFLFGGLAFRLSAAKLTVHVFHEKKFRKYEKNFQKIDKILKTILTLPFCQSIIMVEKYIRKQRAHGMCKK